MLSWKTEDDIAIRVISDHVRAVSFPLQMVNCLLIRRWLIRRILRRAIRYGFHYLDKELFDYMLVQTLHIRWACLSRC
jgi:alanyl-tRNA synthetase